MSSQAMLEFAGAGPLIGRSRELETISTARGCGSAGVVVHAPAGVGKSRLARAALAAAADGGARTAWVQATRSAASVPLGAFAGVIPVEVRSDDLFELLRLSARAILELAGAHPLVLGVDDAQLLDPTSAALVLHLVSTAAAFLVATVRSGDPCPDAVVSLWKDAGVQRLELERLGERETGELVESILGGPVQESARRWIWETSRGNALFIHELVRGALDAGSLQQVGGFWRMPERPPISASLTELISARLEGLTADERAALELLALGEPLRIGELSELTGMEVLAGCEAAELLTIDGLPPTGQVRLAHPLYGEAIRAGLGTLRGHSARLRLAATVRARPALEPEDALRVARWLLDAGETVPTPLLIQAARAANRAGDPGLGAKLAASAREAGGGVEAALLLARAHAIGSRFEQAEAVLTAAEGELASEAQAAEYLQQQIRVLWWGLHQTARLSALFERARTWWPGDGWQRQLEPLRLLVAAMAQDQPMTREQSAVGPEDSELNPQTRRQMEPLQIGALYWGGSTGEALRRIRLIRPALPLCDLTDELALGLSIVISIQGGYDWAELDRWMSELIVQAVRGGDHAGAGLAAKALGWLRLLDGRLLDAKRWLHEAELNFERHDVFGSLPENHALQVCVAAAGHDAEGAVAALERCRAALGGREPFFHELPLLTRAEAWAAYVSGDRTAAQKLLLNTAQEMAKTPLHAAELTYDALLVGAPARKVADQMRALRRRTDAPLVAAYGEHADGCADRDGAALMEVSGVFERIGALRYATEAAADGARAFIAAGRQDSARRAASRARELFAHGQGGAAPVIDGLDGAAVELTAREAQLIELARQGLTNAQIAERLVLSVRTVESHMYRAMQKLGVSDRRKL